MLYIKATNTLQDFNKTETRKKKKKKIKRTKKSIHYTWLVNFILIIMISCFDPATLKNKEMNKMSGMKKKNVCKGGIGCMKKNKKSWMEN